MKKNVNDNTNKKYINETLAKSKTLTRSVNIFMQQNNLGNNNNNNLNQNKNEQTNRKRKGSVNMAKIKEK